MPSKPPYKDPNESTRVRTVDLLERMTRREKVGQLVGMHVGSFTDTRKRATETTAITDVEVAIRDYYIGSVSPFGTGISKYNQVSVAGRIANRLQRVAMNETRLGIPLLVAVDAIHGHANIERSTVFPQNLGMAATWNPDIVKRAARVTAAEMSATGANQNYSPTADIARDPRWGRTYETYGESTTLVEEFVSAEIRGLQGDDLDDPTAVAATVKHYPASSGPTRGEDTAPIDVSPETLWRVYLPPFERAVSEGVAGVMPAYNAIGNQPAHSSKYYLDEVLRKQLKFGGVVCSDWLGIRMLADRHQVAASLRDAVDLATDASLDIASVGGPEHAQLLYDLVEKGTVSEERLDESTYRVLELKFELGLFDDPYVPPKLASETVGSSEHRAVARDAASESVTLLQNRNDVLPLNGEDDVFVTGPNADSIDNLLGGWTVYGVDDSQGQTIYGGLVSASGPEMTVDYETGIVSDVTLQPDEIAERAAAADTAIVVLGEPWYLHEFGPKSITDSSSGFPTRNQLKLPDVQKELLETVCETGTPVVLLVITGRPLVLTDVVDQVSGLLVGFFPGIEGGGAIADILLGRTNPSGRLPISFPRTIGDLPVRHDWLPHPSPIGSQEHLPSYNPLFEFGYGLSYTEFTYKSLEVSDRRVLADDGLSVEVTVTNTGNRSGTETVQLFGQHLQSSVVTPVRELLAFTKIDIAPGETETALFELDSEDLAVVRPDGSRVVESVPFELYVNELSREITIR
ncbi:glycoside hydrolase family 3 N-terminal domain-containing protein [Halococcus hamelinensis]|nr:glycoside hydrolase family 3 N-terminal domain-containing protein [Halococcus hamelinensis]